MIKLETPRLFIRNFRHGDASDLHEIIVQKEAGAYAAYDYEWPTGIADVRGIVSWFSAVDQYLAVCLKDTGKVIGFLCLTWTEDDVYDLGYSFNFDYHGQGYATEGCRALVDYAFSTLHARQVTAGTAAVNAPSCRLLARLGMQKTGESIESFRKNPDGSPIEFTGYRFALTRDEWAKLVSK